MSLETFILSELYTGDIAYGSELKRRFEAAAITSWSRVCHSSIYRALARLEGSGFVCRFSPGASLQKRRPQGGAARKGGDPDGAGKADNPGRPGSAGKTIKTGKVRGAQRNRKFYAITAHGRRRFEALLSGELAEPRTYRNPLNIAVHCLRALPPPRAVALLETRKRRLAAHEALAQEAAWQAMREGREASYERMAAERILVKTRAELFFAGSLAEYLGGGGSG